MNGTQVRPFVLFGDQHLWVMFITLALTIVLPLAVRKLRSEQVTRTVSLTLALVLLVGKISEPIYRITVGQPWPEVLPLHLCDLGGVLAAIMLINRSYYFYELTYFWGLGGTLQAILTPTLKNAFPHIDFWLYFVTHGLIIVGAVYATVLFGYRPTLKSIWRTFLTTLSLALIIAPINWFLNTNYLYLCAKPPTASLIDYLGPWPWYLLSLVPVSLVFFLIYYSPFWLADLTLRAKTKPLKSVFEQQRNKGSSA